MKYLGIGIMAVSLAGAGFLAADRWRERLEILLLLRRMVYCLKGEILYAGYTLPEALAQAGNRFAGERNGVLREPPAFFLRVSSRTEAERGTPFFSVWKEEMEKFPRDFPLDRADRQALCTLGENLGYADRDRQEKMFLLYLEQLEDSIDSLKKELAVRTRLYRSLGAAAGLFLAVIMM